MQLPSIAAVHAYVRAVREHALADALDEVIPAQRTVMLVGQIEVVREIVRDVPVTGEIADETRLEARTVELEVRYDGPDLEELAQQTGLEIEEIIALHSGATYSVDFFGFAPGLAYFSGLPEELRVPRRPSPRTKVSPGSVAIANDYCVIYPAPTPGGWTLIGSLIGEPLWETDREPPNLVDVGDRVVFRAVR